MKYTPIVLISVFFLISCGGNGKKKMNQQLKTLEQEVQKNFTKEKSRELLLSYDKFIVKYPEDTACKGFMVNAVEISILQQDGANALKFINAFLQDYPDDPRAGMIQFKKAMVYDLLIMDPLRAAAEYDIFIKAYPTHPWRKDAENAMLLIQNPDAFMNNLKQGQNSVGDSTEAQ